MLGSIQLSDVYKRFCSVESRLGAQSCRRGLMLDSIQQIVEYSSILVLQTNAFQFP